MTMKIDKAPQLDELYEDVKPSAYLVRLLEESEKAITSRRKAEVKKTAIDQNAPRPYAYD